ncbi:hypothetical protein TNCV_1682191 [Trichonephila clavipes]|nr:hypothetical protein TNCV_1682191 [Trichonephila clavipes]
MPDRTAGFGAPPDTCAVISTETESGFITEDDTSPVTVTQKLPGRQRRSSRHFTYDVGSVVSVLADVGSSNNFGQSSPCAVSLDGTGCLEGGKWHESMPSDVVGAEVATLLIARSSRSFVFLGRPDPPRRYTLPSGDPLLPTPSNYHIAPTEVAADTSIRPTCFSEAYYTAPIKVRQLLVLPPVTS